MLNIKIETCKHASIFIWVLFNYEIYIYYKHNVYIYWKNPPVQSLSSGISSFIGLKDNKIVCL